MKNGIRIAVLSITVLSMSSFAYGYVFTDITVEQWAGSGANEAVCVIDYGVKSFAFGYRWDGDATGEDMLVALDSETDLVVDYYIHVDYGFGLNGFSCDGYEITGDWSTTCPAYWVSTDGENWGLSGFGASGRILADGAWDGWTQGTFGANWNIIADEPNAPLPEPATISLCLIGALGMLRRRRACA